MQTSNLAESIQKKPKTEETVWELHKFGGTSVATVEAIKTAANIVSTNPSKPHVAVVVSALGGITNSLVKVIELASSRDEAYKLHLSQIKQRHHDVISGLLNSTSSLVIAKIDSDYVDLEILFRAVWLRKTCPLEMMELITGYGELWSALIFSSYLTEKGLKAEWLDAREVLFIENAETVIIDWKLSEEKLKEWIHRKISVPKVQFLVITGYIASTLDGTPTTLKRNGSDFSASVFGVLLNSSSIVIWTDVNGVFSADPRLIPEAVMLDHLSFQEVLELSYFGAKVIHSHALAPALAHDIPILIRNTFNLKCPGTTISSNPINGSSTSVVKGFSKIDDLALLTVEGTSMIGVPGIAQRLFSCLKEAHVSVVMISQASSEHSICLVIPLGQAKLAKERVETAFYREIQYNLIQTVETLENISILAAVGDGMVHTKGVCAKLFTALSRANVNVLAIAQGSSERNISVVVHERDSVRALRSAHNFFYVPDNTISLGLIGLGGVGTEFLNQLHQQIQFLKSKFGVVVKLRGVIGSKKMILSNTGLDLTSWHKKLESSEAQIDRLSLFGETSDSDFQKFVSHFDCYFPLTALVDCTSSDTIPDHYVSWLQRGIHVITPNKKAFSGSLVRYKEIQAERSRLFSACCYETTVGAGLPIIVTLQNMVQTGDQISRIEGILSGTLSYLLNTFSSSSNTKKFSEIVSDAKALGYTEPDPRDDLSGVDFARKLVILSRECGLDLELNQVKLPNLVPLELKSCPVEEFMNKLGKSNLDEEMESRRKEALSQNSVLRIVGVIDVASRSASIEFKIYPASHSFAALSGSDNVVSFTSTRYLNQPLIIRGPGAGNAVTAAGVFGDLLSVIQMKTTSAAFKEINMSKI
eukprot:TRINITY_DN6534_c0_g1_i1.p1 TRINITY_DN6534_c0_g1~~TRINITY_DN6534_c0_g1_i1.p1  ORF type:complete len:902 (+),score=192.39 TRINITY_DN6534_c0_g1_i1:93-2708(+)